jgi:hypothetical protein
MRMPVACIAESSRRAAARPARLARTYQRASPAGPGRSPTRCKPTTTDGHRETVDGVVIGKKAWSPATTSGSQRDRPGQPTPTWFINIYGRQHMPFGIVWDWPAVACDAL